MNFYSVFYWLTVADGVKSVFDTFSNIFTWLAVISFIFFIITVGMGMNRELEKQNWTEEEWTSVISWRKFFARFFYYTSILSLITWIGWVMTPTKKDCLLIVAGGAVVILSLLILQQKQSLLT